MASAWRICTKTSKACPIVARLVAPDILIGYYPAAMEEGAFKYVQMEPGELAEVLQLYADEFGCGADVVFAPVIAFLNAAHGIPQRSVKTRGGAHVEGDVLVKPGGSFVGGDMITGDKVGGDLVIGDKYVEET